jgi:O-antigen/teichoic acid export membrane protein
MTQHQGALRSFAASLSARAIRALGRVGVLLVAARLFPIDHVGEFAFLLGVGVLTAGILDFGVTSFIQREVGARSFDSAALERQALSLRLVTLPLAVLLGWWIARLINPDLSVSGLGTLVFTAALALADFLAAVRRARGEFSREPFEIGPALFGGIGTGLVVGLRGGGLTEFQWALAVGAVALVLPRVFLLRTELRVRTAAHEGLGSPVDLVIRCRWFWFLAVGALLLFELPVILLRLLAEPSEVALYASAARAVGLASQPFLVLGGTFVPSLAFQARHNQSRYRDSVQRLNAIFLAIMPTGLAAAVIGGSLLLRGFGAEYLQAMSVVWLLAVGVLIYLGPPYAGPLLVEGLEQRIAQLVAIAVATAAGLCLILVPDWGAVGAGLAVLVAYAVGEIGHVVLYRNAGLPLSHQRVLLGAAGLAGWTVGAFLAPFPLDWGLLLAGGVIGGGVAVVLLRRTVLFRVDRHQGDQSGAEPRSQ